MQPIIAPYGSWKSPITSDLIVARTIGLSETAVCGDDVYWIESRPSEAGRSVIVRRTHESATDDVTPPPFNARTRVHEYGGGAFLAADDAVYFSNFEDNRVYRIGAGGAIQPVTRDGRMRYADFVHDARRRRLLCVREDHTVSDIHCTNTIVAIDAQRGGDVVLVEGNDFYSSPRLSPDGKFLAWLTWNHPSMPWDGAELWLAQLDDAGRIVKADRVAGGADESIFQPEWSPDGVLHFVSDRTGWWNLYRLIDRRAEALCPRPAEFGAPQWVFGMSLYQFAAPDSIICACNEQGVWRLARLNTTSKDLRWIPTPYTEIRSLRVSGNRCVFIGGSPTEMDSLVSLDLPTGRLTTLQRSSSTTAPEGCFSTPQTIEFPTENGRTSYAFYYPPVNKDYTAPQGEKPPLIVMSHGGPTSAASSTFSLRTQYWTSRGFAVVDVNYGGSSGYGRAYRERLKGAWGVVDVDDCVNAARHLVDEGKADPDRLIIRGGSAGGYTTLAALTFRNVFKAGASYYGISDLEALERDSHKFELRYNWSLIAPYPEAKKIYEQRSPIHYVDRLSCPIILFQGLDDKVVPPNQAEMIVEALRSRNIPVVYIAFEGEGHGFRKAENIKRSLDAELFFYSRVFGFPVDTQPDEVIKGRVVRAFEY